ncbi:DUF1937 family protein [Tropicimonas sp. IMCC34043]|uniref:DUF1937 family protein n=1 Tax=Tropicimonas sp. IMCC34043 TaxID=2248760 RepID=UPI0013001A3C|nr:DUF1937 family protein [Tropicimonas sp. IMCC34043]
MFGREPDWDRIEATAGDWPDLHLGQSVETVGFRAQTGISYLATPYSKLAGGDGGWSSDLSQRAAAAAAVWASDLAQRGVTAVSPIVSAHSMVVESFLAGGAHPDPMDHGFCVRWCRPLLFASARVIVPPIDGWRASVGVWKEVERGSPAAPRSTCQSSAAQGPIRIGARHEPPSDPAPAGRTQPGRGAMCNPPAPDLRGLRAFRRRDDPRCRDLRPAWRVAQRAVPGMGVQPVGKEVTLIAHNIRDVDALPEYPIPPGERLESHSYFAFHHRRWLNSVLGRLGEWDVKGMAVELWCLAQDQDPVGTLPNDDRMIAALLHISTDEWRGMLRRDPNPLHRWTQCRAGGEVRLMHPVVTEVAQAALSGKARSADRKSADSERKRLDRLRAVAAQHVGPEFAAKGLYIARLDEVLAEMFPEGNRTEARILKAIQSLNGRY